MNDQNADLKEFFNEYPIDNNVDVNGSVNATYKRHKNYEEKRNKIDLLNDLRTLNYKTPPLHTAKLLEDLFNDPGTQDGHWLNVAQHWTVKSITSAINKMLKQQVRGEVKIQTAAAYFTYLIKFHKKKKIYRQHDS